MALKGYITRCGAFVKISKADDETVEWIDVAAKEHLEKYAKDQLSLSQDDVQHGIIALRCLDYLRNVPFVQQERDANEPAQQQQETDQESLTAKEQDKPGHGDDEEDQAQGDPDETESVENNQQTGAIGGAAGVTRDLLEYPGEYWLEHAQRATVDIVEEFEVKESKVEESNIEISDDEGSDDEGSDDEELDLSNNFWSEHSRCRAEWWGEYARKHYATDKYVRDNVNDYDDLADVTTLHIAVLSGFYALVDDLLEHKDATDLHKSDSWGYQPLHWACRKDDIALIERLLKAGADVNARRHGTNMTPIWLAAREGHEEVVQYLLDQGAEVDVQDENFGSSLHAAAEDGSTSVVRQLLDHSANVNLTGGLHRRPLNAAAYYGHIEVVQLLLQKGADIDPDEEYRYGSALGAAARKGHDAIARLLLHNGWNVNRKSGIYNGALIAAATYGHVQVVQALLEKDPDVTIREQALEKASKNGRIDVVKKLLQQSHHLRHRQAFLHAASRGHDEILKLLQVFETDQELLSMALYDASDNEHETTVALLIKFGADPDAEGEEYDFHLMIHIAVLG